MKILEASTFKTAPSELRQQLLQSGVWAVNDKLLPFTNNTDKINLLYGSYGSGKSIFIVDRQINKSIEQPYHRFYFGRKVLQDVRGSVFKTIIDRIKERHLKDKFKFSEEPNGSMIITCRETKNEMIPFGSNDAESLKSIKDPTDFFCEELNQFSFEDFGYIFSRLRKEGVLLQFWGAFNTERVYKSHWIRQVFFDGEFKDKCNKLQLNFPDNYFINREDYLNQLQIIANGNAAVLNAIAYGEWGMVRTGDEFWMSFDETKHVKKIKLEESTIHISLDENVNPYITQTVWQVLTKVQEIRQVHELLCESPNNNAPKAALAMVKWLKEINYNNVVYVYGDPSGNKRSTVDENSASFYDKYIAVLKDNGFTVVNRVKKSAPEIALSAAFINEIYEKNLNGWTIIINDSCMKSIEDYILVKVDVDGTMKKPKEKNKDTQVTFETQGHISDSKRYFITTILAKEFEAYKKRGKKFWGVAVG